MEIKESPASRATIRGTPTAEPETELPTNRISQNFEKSTTNAKKLLENRVSGDDLLNTQDLIDVVGMVGG